MPSRSVALVMKVGRPEAATGSRTPPWTSTASDRDVRIFGLEAIPGFVLNAIQAVRLARCDASGMLSSRSLPMIDPRRYARHGCCHVLELRQYLLQPGGTEILVDLFDRHFLEALEQTDMHVPGQFEDLDRRDRFVWLRGFRDMPSRRQALASFYYDGPAWQQHREKANAAMIDSDNVLLLRPVYFGSTYPVKAAPRPPVQPGRVGAMLEVEVQHLEDTQVTAPTTVVDLAEKVIAAARRTGAEVLLVAATHEEPNDFPALPVRDERAVVWLACYPDAESRERTRAELGREDDAEHVRLRAVGRSQIR